MRFIIFLITVLTFSSIFSQNILAKEIARLSDFPNIARGLVARGYSDKQIKGILGENFIGVLKKVCG